jgi:hypothetical protein
MMTWMSDNVHIYDWIFIWLGYGGWRGGEGFRALDILAFCDL